MKTDEAIHGNTELICLKHPALATERRYRAWLPCFCPSIKRLPDHLSNKRKPEQFLTALAEQNVAASTQNQALIENPNSLVASLSRRDI